MRRVVVDASVVAKWVLHEEHVQAARQILAQAEMLAPELLWGELGSTLWKRHRRGESTVADARRMLADLHRLPIDTFGHPPLLPTALDLAMVLGHSIYDCFYLALAEKENSAVVTADRRFHRSVSESILADRIMWIGDVR